MSYFVGMFKPVAPVPPTWDSIRRELVPFFLRLTCPRLVSVCPLPIVGVTGARSAGGGGGGGAFGVEPKHII